MTADRKKMVTTIKFKRPLQTNEPINDMAIPTDGYVSVIGAIGPLNSRREANAHSHDGMNVNSEDIRIDFSSKVYLLCIMFYVYSLLDTQTHTPTSANITKNSNGIWSHFRWIMTVNPVWIQYQMKMHQSLGRYEN